MFEHLDRAHKFFDSHKDNLDASMLQQYSDYETQILALYDKYGITTPQDEKAFIKNLYPFEFCNSKNYFK